MNEIHTIAAQKKPSTMTLSRQRDDHTDPGPILPVDSRGNSLGDRIKAARKKLKLSQSELAGPEYVASYISAIERNKIRPSLKALQLIAGRLQEPVEFLLYGGYGADTQQQSSAGFNLAFQDNLDLAQVLIEQAQFVATEEKAASLQKARQVLEEIPPFELTEVYRAVYFKLEGRILLLQEDYAEAESQINKGLELAVKTAQVNLQIELNCLLGQLYQVQGQLGQALACHREAQELTAQNPGKFTPELALEVSNGLVTDLLALNRFDEAIKVFFQTRKTWSEFPRQQSSDLVELARLIRDGGDYSGSRAILNMSLAALSNYNFGSAVLHDSIVLGELLIDSGQIERAEELFNHTLVSRSGELNLERTEKSRLYSNLSWLKVSKDQLSEGAELAEKALTEARQTESKLALGKALRVSAEVEARLNHPEISRKFFEEAIGVLEQSGEARLLAECCKAFGDYLGKWGDLNTALEYLKRAYEVKALI